MKDKMAIRFVERSPNATSQLLSVAQLEEIMERDINARLGASAVGAARGVCGVHSGGAPQSRVQDRRVRERRVRLHAPLRSDRAPPPRSFRSAPRHALRSAPSPSPACGVSSSAPGLCASRCRPRAWQRSEWRRSSALPPRPRTAVVNVLALSRRRHAVALGHLGGADVRSILLGQLLPGRLGYQQLLLRTCSTARSADPRRLSAGLSMGCPR